MRFCGIDLHSNNSFIVIIDEQDRVVYSQRHANSLPEILEALSAYQDELSGIATESTFNWYWLMDGLQERGYRVHLVNTTAVKQYEGLKHRGDESDAKHLAHLLRLGLLPEVGLWGQDLHFTFPPSSFSPFEYLAHDSATHIKIFTYLRQM